MSRIKIKTGNDSPDTVCNAIMSSEKLWLQSQGFDPEGTLSEPIFSQRLRLDGFEESDGKTTAMFEACLAGRIDVCKWLHSRGAQYMVTKSDPFGSTPMIVACLYGHLDVAKWLFRVGAAADTRTMDNQGVTPMSWACSGGFLSIVEWLWEEGGASDDVRLSVEARRLGVWSPLRRAAMAQHTHIAVWLIKNGAVNSANGHVDAAILRSDLSGFELEHNFWALLAHSLEDLVVDHRNFVSLVLPGAMSVAPEYDCVASSNPALRTSLRKMCCETALLRLVADFAGVLRGRHLRNVQESLVCLRQWIIDTSPFGL